jgi:DNA repair exonuclease SbcCD ATPase subunit
MSEEYPGALDEAKAAANYNNEILHRVLDSMNAALGGVDNLFEALSAAQGGINTSQEQVEQDTVSVQQATTHTEEAMSLHSSAGYLDTNEDARTTRKQLAEAARLLGRASRGFIHLQQQLGHGVGSEITKLHGRVENDTRANLGIGRSMIEVGSFPCQSRIIEAIDAYIERRKAESKTLKAAEEKLNAANTTITPAEEAPTTTEEKLTLDRIVALLSETITALGLHGPVLEAFPARVQALQQMHEEIGVTLMSWTTASEETKAQYRDIGERLARCTLPIAANAVNEHVGFLTTSKNNLQSAQTSDMLAKEFVFWAQRYFKTTMKAIKRYWRRRS